MKQGAMSKKPGKPLATRIRECRLCAAQFAETKTAHEPRPVPWFDNAARLLIVGAGPGYARA